MASSIRRFWLFLISISALLAIAQAAHAHVSEQGIVLLLPTGTYIVSGCLAVIFSMIVVAAMPHKHVFRIFATKSFALNALNPVVENQLLKDVLSILSLVVILGLIIIGFTGSRDPLTNLLPLTIWTFLWVLIFMLHAGFGYIWSWLNPWTGIWNLFIGNPAGMFNIPKWVGQWPATLLYFCFYVFIIVDLAPDDPARLANAVFGYLAFTFVGMFLFGKSAWLKHVEFFSVLFGLLARLAPIQYDKDTKRWRLGLPGWKSLEAKDRSISQSFFLLTVLACGSFDGLNETFWWLGQIGINPLAFPGRSAVVMESTLGMIGASLLVYAVFALVLFASFRLVRAAGNFSLEPGQEFSSLFNALALTILPITAVYHGSHYYISYLVNSQYLVAALSDPLANGANYLGLVNYQVTTGYLGDIASVRRIWLTQAGLVVFGHVLAVLMAHYFIARAFPSRRQAMVIHLPVAVFMAAYTWFGLWLLAAPKGA